MLRDVDIFVGQSVVLTSDCSNRFFVIYIMLADISTSKT